MDQEAFLKGGMLERWMKMDKGKIIRKKQENKVVLKHEVIRIKTSTSLK